MTIQIKRGNTNETYPIDSVEIPDLWHLAMWLDQIGEQASSKAVLSCWHTAHDLKNHIVNLTCDLPVEGAAHE